MNLRNFVVACGLFFILIKKLNSERICKSLEIRSSKDFEQFKNCSIISGHLSIIKTNLNLKNIADLQLNVQEITDYLLVYRVKGLKSLDTLLPHLLVIKGSQLIFQEYALVVYENPDLSSLNLKSLKRIQNGSIKIEQNPFLCFVTTIKWINLLSNKTIQHFSLRFNKPSEQCPTCNVYNQNQLMVNNTNAKRYCWSFEQPQIFGTDAESRCFKGKCPSCSNLVENGKCVDSCKLFYVQLYKRECISYQTCKNFGMVVFDGHCLEKCPANYKTVKDHILCHPICHGSFQITETSDLIFFRECVVLNGSLEFKLTDVKSHKTYELEYAFKELREIMGYLKITQSPSIVSLGFFQKLDTIKGETLYANKFALYVVDNSYLENIWGTNQHVSIIEGHIFFHLNPRLCYEKITSLQSSLRSGNISVIDASPNSNGERVICGNSVRKIDALVEEVNSTSVRIAVSYMSAHDVQVLFGYQYFYKPSIWKNVTMYDGRHGCGYDDWRVDISTSQNRRHVISNLRPYTQYAIFVRSITPIDYHNQIEAISNVIYFQTMPFKPGPVSKIYYETLDTTEMVIHWWPPISPNGEINEYIVKYEEITIQNKPVSNRSEANVMGRKTSAECQCGDQHKLNSIPAISEEYYNKIEKTYEDALPNILYVAKQKSFEKPESKAFKLIDSASLEEVLKNFTNIAKLEAINVQDKNDTNLLIIQPPPICNTMHNLHTINHVSCEIKQNVSGTRVPGDQYFLTLGGLKPETIYNITIRACVKDVQNGCGKSKSIFAKTLNKRLQVLLKGLKFP